VLLLGFGRLRVSKHFYRDVKLILFCKVPDCHVEYRPVRASFFAKLHLCHKHRSVYYRDWYINKFLPFFAKLSKEDKQRYRNMRYEVWKKWVIKNIDKRRLQALESYHRRKGEAKNKARKHRATVAR